MGICNSRQVHKEESDLIDQPNKLTEIRKHRLAPLPVSTHIDHPLNPEVSPSTIQIQNVNMGPDETHASPSTEDTTLIPTDSQAEEEPVLIGEGIFENEPEQTKNTPELAQCTICFCRKKKIWRPCRECNSPSCEGCLREYLIRASKDESLMPVRCCGPYNIGLAKFLLTTEEFELYRAKYEEWATVNRVYCPVPTCSAFIPPRFFPRNIKDLLPKSKKEKMQEKKALPEKPNFEKVEPSYVHCPKCTVQICCSCKQLHHPGSQCPETVDGLDPELARLFRLWGIKRCYKCRAAVRKMMGCNLIACRCGAHWCFNCTRPKDVCDDDECEEEEEEEENNEGEGEIEGAGTSRPNDEEEIEDLDRDAEGDWGFEPDNGEHESSGCKHTWLKNHEQPITGGINNSNYLFDLCERCLCTVVPQENVYPEAAALTRFGFIPHPPVTYDLDSQADFGGKRAARYAPQNERRLVHCFYCHLTLCPECHKKERLNNWLLKKEYA